ncbi:MAG: SPOR domain-containing protein [Candidatus Acidiferrales bacterium]
MAGGGKRGGGDRVLESRHLVGLFLGVVLLCGVFFTLGYVMGKTQYDGAVHAAASPNASAPLRSERAKSTQAESRSAAVPAPNASEWDFYGKKQDNDDHLQPAPKSSSPWVSSSPAANAQVAKPESRRPREIPTAARFRAPRIARGAIVLQVAALRHEGDALAMAEMLQRKRFPSFVITPSTDRFYRVQVGPYRNERSAENARRALERAGFKAIMKR